MSAKIVNWGEAVPRRRFPFRTASGMFVMLIEREGFVGLVGELPGCVGALGLELELELERRGQVTVRTLRFGNSEGTITTGELGLLAKCLPELMELARREWPEVWRVGG